MSGEANDHRYAVYFGVRFGFRDTDASCCRAAATSVRSRGRRPDALSTRGFFRGTARPMLVPLGRNDDLQLRGEGGIVVARSREGIPSTFLFRTGGDQTVRGYDFREPRRARRHAVLGGRYLAVGSVEYALVHAPTWGSPRSSTPATRGTRATSTRRSASASRFRPRSGPSASTSPTAKRKAGACTSPSGSCF